MSFRQPSSLSRFPIRFALLAAAAVLCGGLLWAQGPDSDGDLLLDSADPYPADPFNGGWQLLASSNGSSPLLRHEGDCCRVGDKILFLGGRETMVVEYYDPIANTWEQTANAPIDFSHFQSVQVNGLVYVIGAFSGSYPDEIAVPDIYIYNPASRTWSKGPQIPFDRRRGAGAAGVYNGKIYIVGGNTKGHRAGWVPWFDEFDPATGVWKRLPDAPQPRDHHRAVVMQNRLYVVSGRQSEYDSATGTGDISKTVKEIEVYDFQAGAWFTLAQSLPTPRAGCGVVSHGRDVIVAAGENGGGPAANVEALDVVSGDWRTLPNLTQARNAPSASAIGDRIYVAGGQDPANASLETILLPPRPIPSGATGLLSAPYRASLQNAIFLNSGGASAGSFGADAKFSGGSVVTTRSPISGASAAPEAVYKSQRTGAFSYAIDGLDPEASYRVQLHFAELEYVSSGQRKFDVRCNGLVALDDFDIVANAGGKGKAITRSFSVRPLATGRIDLEFAPVLNGASLAGLAISKVQPFPLGAATFSLVKPYDVLARVGHPVSFSAEILGKPPSGFQWRRNGANLSGGTSSTYTIPSVTLSQAGSYAVLAGGSVLSSAASLIVAGDAAYTPSVLRGGATSLTLGIAGTGASFQWYRNGLPLGDGSGVTGARTSKLSIAGFGDDDLGNYECKVSAFGDEEFFGPYNLRYMQPPVVTNAEPQATITIGTVAWALSSSEPQTTFSVQGLPPGLVYHAPTATVRGTPTKSGFYTIIVTPRNPAGIGSSKSFVLRVEAFPVPARGTFVGLFDRGQTVNGNLGGSLRISVSSLGDVAGTLVNGAAAYTIRTRLTGVAGGDPTCLLSIPRGRSTPLILSFSIRRTDGFVSGNLGVGSSTVGLEARPALLNPSTPASSVLNCFLGLENVADIGNTALPQGTGWMRVTRVVSSRDKTTSAVGSGRLPDGTPVTFSVLQCSDLQVPIRALLPARNGSLQGWVNLAETGPSRHSLEGSLNWRKTAPAASKDYTYRTGIDVDLFAEGITYVAPASGKTILGGGSAPGNARIEFSEGGLEFAAQGGLVDQTFQLTGSQVALFGSSSANPTGVSVVIVPSTGTFSGAFRLKDGTTLRDVRFQGIFAGVTGEGFFTLPQLPLGKTSPVRSGLVRIFAP